MGGSLYFKWFVRHTCAAVAKICRNIIMKTLALFAVAGLLAVGSGCSTTRTLEQRRQDRYGSYAALSSEQKTAVDLGHIKVGMPMDAVYIAWGRPSQILTSETAAGTQTHWLYTGTYFQPYSYWSYSEGFGPFHRAYVGPSFTQDYSIVNYISAEVVFEGGLVKEWRTMPHP